MARGIEPEQRDENLSLGRLVDQNSYAREKHQIDFGDSKFDFIQDKNERLVVAEIKKSSRTEKASRLQLAHYLYQLQKEGIEADGVLLFPTEKTRVEVKLTPDLEKELDSLYAEIEALTSLPTPPPLAHCKYCSKCAYGEYCWG